MAEPFVKLYKKMLDWEWYDDANTMRLFIHCLLRANWKEGSWHGIPYKPGQFITSIPTLANETDLSVQQVRTALSHLISTGEVTSYQQGKCRIITVNNWDLYQDGNKVSNKKTTGYQQDGNKVVTTDKEYKEIKEEKEYIYSSVPEIEKAFSEFVEMRKKIRKPMSDRAVELAIEKLNKLSGGNTDLAVKIIDQSIMYSYQGLFPLKDEGKQNTKIHNFEERRYDYKELENLAIGDKK